MYTWGYGYPKRQTYYSGSSRDNRADRSYLALFYKRIGLIHPIDREENTRRRYTADDVG